ncbi:hypothetical protein, partial [Neisseria dentiae]|uniref:hypothetical protein n=1 Tax=Neisseria dentiae TaxID=194197 RepID=UPI00359F9A1F
GAISQTMENPLAGSSPRACSQKACEAVFLRKNPQMQGKKHSKIGHLASIFNAAAADFNQKYRRNAF